MKAPLTDWWPCFACNGLGAFQLVLAVSLLEAPVFTRAASRVSVILKHLVRAAPDPEGAFVARRCPTTRFCRCQR